MCPQMTNVGNNSEYNGDVDWDLQGVIRSEGSAFEHVLLLGNRFLIENGFVMNISLALVLSITYSLRPSAKIRWN